MRRQSASKVEGFEHRHSHTVITRQPSALNAVVLRLSRVRLSAIFPSQNSVLVLARFDPWLQWCPCQKHPWTNTTVRCRGRTISGVPGNSRTWIRNRSPAACRNFRTASSGAVSLRPIRRISVERCVGVVIDLANGRDYEGTNDSRAQHEHGDQARSRRGSLAVPLPK